MTPRIQRIALYVLFAFAFVWPWDVYQYLPGAGVYIANLLAVALVVLLGLDLLLGRTLRLPFELLWPVTALAVLLAAARLLHAAPSNPMPLFSVLLTFAATVHFARSRRCIDEWLTLSCLSAVGGACCTLAALFTPLAPTAYSLDTNVALAFARDLSGGAFTLAVGLVISGHLLAQARQKAAHRWPALLLWAIATCLLLVVLLLFPVLWPRGGFLEAWDPPRVWSLPFLEAAAFLVFLWLAARIAARLRIAHTQGIEYGGEVFAPPRTLLDLIAAAVLFCLCFAVRPTPAHGFLLGIAAAYPLPTKLPQPWLPRWKYILLVPCAALVVFNLFHVDASNPTDPRNYDVAAKADFQAGRFDLLSRRIARIEIFSPNERRTHLWQARMDLASGYPHYAAYEFGRAVSDPAGALLLLPPPSETDRQDFLVRLRDFCSSSRQPERMLAYEQALAASGHSDSALDSLRARVFVRNPSASDLPSGLFAEAAAFLLGDEKLAEPLGAWTSAELIVLLEQWGAVVEQAPAEFPASRLPLVLAAQAAPEVVRTWAKAGAGAPAACRVPATATFFARPADPLADWGDAGWGALAATDGVFTITLRLPEGGTAITVRIEQDGSCTCVTPASMVGVAPDLPAIRVYVHNTATGPGR